MVKYSERDLLLGGSGSRGRGTTGGGEANSDLEGIVDEPLEGGESTNHENTEAETTPDSGGAELGEDGANTGRSLVLVELGDDTVSEREGKGSWSQLKKRKEQKKKRRIERA